jgi:hypothetical protein
MPMKTLMATARRRFGPVTVIVLAAIWTAWLGFRTQVMGDYPMDFAPAMNALLSGHVGAFVQQLPTNGDGGALPLYAPAALLGKLLSGSQHAIFRFGALACLLALGALGLYLARGMRVAGRPAAERAVVIGVCVLAPALLDVILYGHPEEALGAALCVGAVLLAGEEHVTLAGLALGLALVNKPWGVLAVIPVVLAAPRGRTRLCLVAGAIAAGWIAGIYVVDPSHFRRIALVASGSEVAFPGDLWWPLSRLQATPGVGAAYFPPALVAAHARELVVLLALPISLPLALRRDRSPESPLALLALLFLARCMLDPSNHVYYQLPLVIAIAAYECRCQRMPVVALLAIAGFWVVFHPISTVAGLNLQYATYLAVSLPLLVYLIPPATGTGWSRLIPARAGRPWEA